jgi:small-conductance mechanosensitive channel
MDPQIISTISGLPTLNNEGVNSTFKSISEYGSNNSLTFALSTIQSLDPIGILANIIIIILIIVGTNLLAKLADRMLQNYFLKIAERMFKHKLISRGETDVEAQRTANLIIRRLVMASIYIIGMMLVILQIPPLTKFATALLAGAGIAGLAIGFAAKDALANLISGVFIAIFQPFRVGDYVTFRTDYGQIEDLTLRHTVICTWDKRRIVVPNSVVSNEAIVNWSLENPVSTWTVNFGISYKSDIDLAKRIVMEEAMKHPNVLHDADLKVLLSDLGDPAMILRLAFNVPSRDVAFTTGCQIREAVKKRFDEAGIEIPLSKI